MLFSHNMRSLVLNGATLGGEGHGDIAAFVGDHCTVHHRFEGLGATASLAATCQALLRTLGWKEGPERIIAIVGPGSFTGLRASLALANGLAFGYGSVLRGVTIGACFRAQKGWEDVVCLTRARRNHLFVEWADGTHWAGAPAALDLPPATCVVGSGADMLGDDRASFSTLQGGAHPDISLIFAAGLTAPNVASLLPLYIDAPEAKLPARGLRPAPLL